MIKKSKIWFVCIGEPVPFDNNFSSLHRCGQLAYQFSLEGNDVSWFTSKFDHFSKSFLDVQNHTQLSKNFEMFYLLANSYKKNISFSRFINHYYLAKNFKKKIKSLSKPDIIYASFPSIELAYETVKFGKINNIPVVVDFRDLWPDIFLTAFPKILRPFGMVALLPWYLQRRYIFKNAKSIVAISNGFLKFAHENSNKRNIDYDRVFYKSYISNLHIAKSKSKIFKAIYFGAISRNKTNLKSVIEVFNDLGDQYELIICGEGDDIKYYKNISSNNIIFKGFIQKPDMEKIISECSVGIVPLKSRVDFIKAIPNKAIEYLSYGIPILTSLSGDLQNFIDKNKVGLFYNNQSELKNHILRLKSDQHLLDELSNNASKIFLNKFDFSKNFESIKNHFISLIDKN